MFLDKSELKTVAYQYILDQITEGDDSILDFGIESAIEEVKSYLTPNNQHQWKDGRLLYDVNLIFSATGSDRNALILGFTKTVAIWKIIQLCNADMIYQNTKDQYDRAIDYLNRIAKGVVTISTLPTLDPTTQTPATNPPFYFGSRTKFNHEF